MPRGRVAHLDLEFRARTYPLYPRILIQPANSLHRGLVQRLGFDVGCVPDTPYVRKGDGARLQRHSLELSICFVKISLDRGPPWTLPGIGTMVGAYEKTHHAFHGAVRTPISGQSKSEVIYWPASTLGGYSATLKTRQTEKKTQSASEILSDLGNHKFEILRRDGSGAGELHQNWTDIFIVQNGEATILYGGSIEDAKDTGNGEIRGPGYRREIAKGDGRRCAGDAARHRASNDRRAGKIILRPYRQSAAITNGACGALTRSRAANIPNVAPWPTSLSTSMAPPSPLTMPYTIERPSPVP